MALPDTTQCIHHWVLSEATMKNVRASCRRCGARRTYPSAIELDYYQAVPNYDELDDSVVVLTFAPAPVEEEAHV